MATVTWSWPGGRGLLQSLAPRCPQSRLLPADAQGCSARGSGSRLYGVLGLSGSLVRDRGNAFHAFPEGKASSACLPALEHSVPSVERKTVPLNMKHSEILFIGVSFPLTVFLC